MPKEEKKPKWFVTFPIAARDLINAWASLHEVIMADKLQDMIQIYQNSKNNTHRVKKGRNGFSGWVNDLPNEMNAFANLKNRINKKKKNSNFQTSLTYWLKEYQKFNNNISVFKNNLGLGLKSKKELKYSDFQKYLFGLSIPVKNLEVVKQIEEKFFEFHPSIITEKKKDQNGNTYNQHYIMIGWLSLVNHGCYNDGLKFYQINAEKKRDDYFSTKSAFDLKCVKLYGISGNSDILYKPGKEIFVRYTDGNIEILLGGPCKCPCCKNEPRSNYFIDYFDK